MPARHVYAVHQNTDLSLYESAARGNSFLFYSTRPMETKRNCRDRDFAGEFFVPGSRAMELREMILNEASPEKIVDTLHLRRETLDGLRDRLRPTLPFPRYKRPEPGRILDSIYHPAATYIKIPVMGFQLLGDATLPNRTFVTLGKFYGVE